MDVTDALKRLTDAGEALEDLFKQASAAQSKLAGDDDLKQALIDGTHAIADAKRVAADLKAALSDL